MPAEDLSSVNRVHKEPVPIARTGPDPADGAGRESVPSTGSPAAAPVLLVTRGDMTAAGTGAAAIADAKARFASLRLSDPDHDYSLRSDSSGIWAIPAGRMTHWTVESRFREMRFSHVLRALNAREAALVGDLRTVRSFASDALGLWSGWGEPVSTALLGGWSDPLDAEGELTLAAVEQIKAEALAIHRQLTPLWRRKVSRKRLLLLDTPLGDGLTLHDLVAGQAADSAPAEDCFEDHRLRAVLAVLSPDERAVALALAYSGVGTWAEAAAAAGVAQPADFGERVRRKVKRLAARSAGRSLPGTTTAGAGR
ncbi:hypothetical protein ACFYUY_38380 [Kitasatospora sp. NPDC004745]|uniref:hypothetical protein n=1 Tax=Kitasatospora sp. NPDC004745 TaxID=3364019 RepID=UPI0036C1C6E2